MPFVSLDLIAAYGPTHATKCPRVGDFGAMSRNTITSRPSGSCTPWWRSPESAHGASSAFDHVFPSSRLNIIRLHPSCVFSRMRQQSSLPSGERNTYGSHGSLPSTAQTDFGSLHVKPPSFDTLCNTPSGERSIPSGPVW